MRRLCRLGRVRSGRDLGARSRVGTDLGLEALVYNFDSHPRMVAMARWVAEATLKSTEKQLC